VTESLVLAVPSKGRLQEQAAAFFARAGLEIIQARGARDYRGRIQGLEGVEVAFLSASEIAKELGAGTVHLGVTGEDLLREQVAEADARLHLVAPLGFGRANVVVAVPQAWIDVRSMEDLDDVAAATRARRGRRLRVATKYVNLTRGFFAEKRVADYRIVESLGATEGAPAAGSADLIVDITTTGATLQANGLRVLEDGVILRSQAYLVAALDAPWSGAARSALTEILTRVAAEETARGTREVRVAAADPGAVAAALAGRFAATPSVGGAELVLHVPESEVFALAAFLRGLDTVGTIAVHKAEAVFCRDNPMLSRLLERIGP